MAYLGFQVVKKVEPNGTVTFDAYGDTNHWYRHKHQLFGVYQVKPGTFLSEAEAEAAIAANSSGAVTTTYDSSGKKSGTTP